MLKYKSKLKTFSRELRRNMTDAEQLLWSRLRRKQLCAVQFYRQKPIGDFIVDFFAPAVGLVIEIDGGQHFEKEQRENDRLRDRYLADLGLVVLRFDNDQILRETDAVVEAIFKRIQELKGNPP